ncbi:MAG: hypothetical protein NTW19_03175 [Planctomycetota bacterium]|nr:hypothetical protein [Planctomycetota bacterium]
MPPIPRFLLALLLLTLAAPAARGQILRGEWVDQSQKEIEARRKTALRVMVLDKEGKPVEGAPVRISLRRQAFALGAPMRSLPVAADMKGDLTTGPGMLRCVNAMSLDALTDWPRIKPKAGAAIDTAAVEEALARAASRGNQVRWGTVLSADTGRLPEWVAELQGPALRAKLGEHVAWTFEQFGRRADQFDIYSDTLQKTFVEDRLGVEALRGLVEKARASAPGATLCVRLEDGLAAEKIQPAIRRITALRESFVDIDMIAIEARFSGTVSQIQLARSLAWLRGLDIPIVIVGLEVGGPSPAAAAINIEVVLRTLYAEPAVRGIHFAGLRADEFTDPAAALLEADGAPTPAGQIVDKLFTSLWRTETLGGADPLGNVRCKVFPGHYEVEAILPDRSIARGSFFVPQSERERLAVVQPLP